MLRSRSLLLLSLLVIFGVFTWNSAAQNLVDEECAVLVTEAAASVEQVCAMVAGGEACYVRGPITYEAQEGASFVFESPADRAPLSSFHSISTAALDVESEEWGIAVLALPVAASDPEATEEPESELGEVGLRFVMIGDVTLTDTSEETETAPMHSFTVATQDSADCVGAPSRLFLQTPGGSVIDVTVNGATFTLQESTTIAIEAIPDDKMEVIVITGSITISALGGEQALFAGQMTILVLGGDTGLWVIFAPVAPIMIEVSEIQFLPLSILLEVIEIPSAEVWTSTGIMLEEGQVYSIQATEFVKTSDELEWTAPGGHTPADCAASGRADWDCVCRSLPEWGTCTMAETASMVLLGRIGEGDPFVVGAGGVFVAPADGELSLGPNDNDFSDNIGSYYALINVLTSGQ